MQELKTCKDTILCYARMCKKKRENIFVMICIVNTLIFICKNVEFIRFSLQLCCIQGGEDKKRRKRLGNRKFRSLVNEQHIS